METLVFNELKKYIKSSTLRYDVPGHKGIFRNKFTEYFGDNIIKADVNSMKRLDNLNFSKSIIKKTQKNIAKVHNAIDSRILVNGSTIGIQSMIMASIKPNEYILVPRNVHKSIESAIILSGAIPIYVNPEFDEELCIFTYLSLKKIKQKIKEFPNIKTVVLINPSYFGISYEFEKIVKYLKKNGKIVLVDEAHGAHLYFGCNRPKNAMEVGADMSCLSYHKTLGSLTQSSLLLFNSDIVDIRELDKFLTMLTTTSPSYLLISSIETTVSYLDEIDNKVFDDKINLLNKYKKKINNIKGISVLDNKFLNINENDFDKMRLVIKIDNLSISGFDMYDILRDEYNIQIELGEYNLILAIISIYDDFKNIDRLITALEDISCRFLGENKNKIKFNFNSFSSSNLSLRDLFYKEKELINLKEANNKLCGESIMIYPPGIAIIKQGELFNNKLIEYLEDLSKKDIDLLGVYDNKVNVIKE